MAQPSASPSHRYHSWGRTRGPKNLSRPEQGSETVTATAAPSLVTDGLSTENQRYLHLYLDTTPEAENRTITVWGWNHAFGLWFEMTDVGGSAITIAASTAKAHKIVEIAGTDRVYFQANSALNAANKFFAACSTF